MAEAIPIVWIMEPPVKEVSEEKTDKETDNVKKARIETVQLMDSTKEQVKEEKLEEDNQEETTEPDNTEDIKSTEEKKEE